MSTDELAVRRRTLQHISAMFSEFPVPVPAPLQSPQEPSHTAPARWTSRAVARPAHSAAPSSRTDALSSERGNALESRRKPHVRFYPPSPPNPSARAARTARASLRIKKLQQVTHARAAIAGFLHKRGGGLLARWLRKFVLVQTAPLRLLYWNDDRISDTMASLPVLLSQHVPDGVLLLDPSSSVRLASSAPGCVEFTVVGVDRTPGRKTGGGEQRSITLRADDSAACARWAQAVAAALRSSFTVSGGVAGPQTADVDGGMDAASGIAPELQIAAVGGVADGAL